MNLSTETRRSRGGNPTEQLLDIDQEAAAVILRGHAWSLQRIGDVLGVDGDTIGRLMRQRGVPAPRQRKVRRAGATRTG